MKTKKKSNLTHQSLLCQMSRFLCLLLCATIYSASVFAQGGIRVSGKVTDNNGDPLPGVNVTIKGTTMGNITNMDGKYTVSVPTTASILQFSFIGFSTQEIAVGTKTTINVTLTDDTKLIDEVVVVGYGIQRKSDLTGSITSIKAKDITGIASGNAAETLQGKSGLFVVTNGTPGASPDVRIRGVGTNGNSNPLYVVDGMMVNSISFLNSNDIESMDVLKDASATAIYGSRGANGVIMITTKKGTTNSKPVVTYNGSEGFHFMVSKFDVGDATDYARLVNIMSETAGQGTQYANPSEFGKGTNWTDEVSRNGWARDHQLALTGGSDKVTYNVSAGYFSQKGLYKDTEYDRMTFRINNEYKISNTIKIGHNLSLSNSHNPLGPAYRFMRSVYGASPLLSPHTDNGEWTKMQSDNYINPVAELELNNDYNSKQLRFVGNFWGTWEIIPGLTFRTNFGEDWSDRYTHQFKIAYNINPSHQSNATNTYMEDYSTDNTWIWENTLSYEKTLAAIHRINLLGGYTAEEFTERGLGAHAFDYLLDNTTYVNMYSASTNNRTVDPSNASKTTRVSYLFRANYALKDRYLLTATLRADGSSKFGANNRWGYFPSAALGWRISEETFMKQVNWINNLKLRGSWGQTGNDKITNNAAYTLVSVTDEFHAIYNGQFATGAGIVSASNPDIKWERTQQLDLGFDMSVLNNHLSFEFDYFDRETKDLLMTLPIKGGTAGITPAVTNAGTVSNKGYEFTIRWQDYGKEFKYGTSLSASSFKNKVLDWGGLVTTSDIWSTPSFVRIEEGQPLSYFYGYNVIGIYHTQADLDQWNSYAQGKGQSVYHSNAKVGDLIWEDVNGDGRISSDDQTNIGNPFPKFTGSVSFNAEYKGFDFVVDIAGSYGAKVLNSFYHQVSATLNDNMHRDWLDAWTPNNPNGSMPRLANGSINVNNATSLPVSKADYIKLRSVELGYSLPKNLIQKIGISRLRVYVSTINSLYLTNYNGFSAEVTGGVDSNTYPLSGNTKIGLNLSF